MYFLLSRGHLITNRIETAVFRLPADAALSATPNYATVAKQSKDGEVRV